MRMALMKNSLVVLAIVASVTARIPTASAAFGIEEADISKFCNAKAARQTLIYIDDRNLYEGSTDWAKRLDQKLRANLLPNEPVNIMRLSSMDGAVKESGVACWPDYSPEERARINQESYVFSEHPLKALEGQQQVFQGWLAKHLTEIYTQGKRAASGGPQMAESGVKRQIVRALSADEGRLNSGKGMLRIIIYSDMLEQSDLADVVKQETGLPEAGASAAKKLGLDAQNATVYVYGAGGGVDAGTVERAKAFWTSFFQTANGMLASFGTDLNMPGSAPAQWRRYDVQVNVPDQSRIGRMTLIADGQGKLQDSVLSFGVGRSAVIEGTLNCSAAGKCALEAKTRVGVITQEAGEEVRLEGSLADMKGWIGFPNERLANGEPAAFEMHATVIEEAKN